MKIIDTAGNPIILNRKQLEAFNYLINAFVIEPYQLFDKDKERCLKALDPFIHPQKPNEVVIRTGQGEGIVIRL